MPWPARPVTPGTAGLIAWSGRLPMSIAAARAGRSTSRKRRSQDEQKRRSSSSSSVLASFARKPSSVTTCWTSPSAKRNAWLRSSRRSSAGGLARAARPAIAAALATFTPRAAVTGGSADRRSSARRAPSVSTSPSGSPIRGPSDDQCDRSWRVNANSSRRLRCWAGCTTPGLAGEVAGLRVLGVGGGVVRRLLVVGAEAAAHDLLGPPVDDGHLVVALVLRAPIVELRPVPVALPVEVVLELRGLDELVGVVAVAEDLVAARAVAHRLRRDVRKRLLERVAAEDRRVPGDVDDADHQAPTSAMIAGGPSAVRPWPGSVAPTRIAILPACLFSCMSWWALATSSKPIVFHSTGRILDCSMSWLALRHCHALAKCEPMICFWRIHR